MAGRFCFTFSSRSFGVLPGFRITLIPTLITLAFLLVIPTITMIVQASVLTWPKLQELANDSRVMSAFRVSLITSAIAALFVLIVGVPVAWVLTRYRFPGRRLLDAMIDLPFALPTAVSGITLSALYSDSGWIGSLFATFGIKIAYTPIGIVVALAFIGLPFVVRTVEPVLINLDRTSEEAAITLGANSWSILYRVIIPPLLPAMLTGAALAFARGLGEYGSVVFIAGNYPGLSEIVPLLIVTKLEQFDYAGAAMIGVVMMMIAFVLLMAINILQAWSCHRNAA